MIFVTLNSSYEVDEENKLIRRLEGDNPPTPHQGDGGWREYSTLTLLANGSYLIQWDEGGNKSTMTSRVLGELGARLGG